MNEKKRKLTKDPFKDKTNEIFELHILTWPAIILEGFLVFLWMRGSDSIIRNLGELALVIFIILNYGKPLALRVKGWDAYSRATITSMLIVGALVAIRILSLGVELENARWFFLGAIVLVPLVEILAAPSPAGDRATRKARLEYQRSVPAYGFPPSSPPPAQEDDSGLTLGDLWLAWQFWKK